VSEIDGFVTVSVAPLIILLWMFWHHKEKTYQSQCELQRIVANHNDALIQSCILHDRQIETLDRLQKQLDELIWTKLLAEQIEDQDRGPFVQQILANPNDVGHMMIYADWLATSREGNRVTGTRRLPIVEFGDPYLPQAWRMTVWNTLQAQNCWSTHRIVRGFGCGPLARQPRGF
jgi:uncharacterized protein (TIGR02996 family)